ncbi:Fungal transcriptional regulatory protein [Rutstroemia sp. NJR-2017a BVV2]|nr:Fungal transcriptional regulatory protein [Rutstroemia sp. NJR-2017a BVV2]
MDPFTTYDFVNMAPHGTPTSGMSDWNISAPAVEFTMPKFHQDAAPRQMQRQLPPQLHRIHTLSIGRSEGLGLSSSVDSLSPYPDSDYTSPISQSFQNEDVPFLNSPVPMYNSYASSRTSATDQSSSILSDARGPTSCPDQFYAQSEMSSSISSHQNVYEVAEPRQRQRSHQGSPSVHEIFYDDEMLDYYEKIICPSVVVIDSPSNPYREHILALASSSQSLQHAICALAACNLRMKRKQSLGQDIWRQPIELELQDRINAGGPIGRPVCTRRTSTQLLHESSSTDSSLQEEYQHRSLAVSLLNQQLSDPSKACHDSVLATLFILCHYRMCESGIAQFRTQFAGVKKILGMRESGIETGNWGWMESLFTYFDGIAASINDREAQLRGGYLDILANPSNPNHALENMAGCDSLLFKTIAKLGRLNLLSQNRPVLNELSPSSPLLTRNLRPQARPRLAGQALVDFYNLHAQTLSFDGNGFASTLDEEPSFPMHNLSSPTFQDDLRTTFWTEWKSSRLALQEWEFDPSRVVASLPVTPSPTQLRDFGYISEAFRYSALLYTERLACPKLPSSHLNFQNLVSQVLFYVTSLEAGSGAEKFLLWPLFISGSECVNELQQSIVRTKCREIMGRSGYLNNLAGLEVLEKLWAEKDGAEDVGSAAFRYPSACPFRWTRYMEGVEGEWIMV